MAASQASQWLSAIFDESAIDFEVMSLLTPQIVLTENLAGIVGQDLAFMITDHIELESEYNSLIKTLDRDGEHVEAESENVKLVGKQLTDLLRRICRIIRKEPYILRFLRRDPGISREEWFKILSHLAEYFQIVKRKVVALCDENYDYSDGQFDDLTNAHEESMLKQKELKAIFIAEKKERDLRNSQGNAKIEKLSKEIDKLKNDLAQKKDETSVETRSAQQNVQFKHETMIKRLNQETIDLSSRMETMRLENTEKEAKFRKDLRRLESELSDCIHKYDTEMTDLTAQYNSLKKLYDEDSETLVLVKEKTFALVAEREAHEFAIAEEKRLQEETARIQYLAASKIQALCRGWKCRNEFKRKKDKKGKGKGKGKKTKK